jgi:hypothetical protein
MKIIKKIIYEFKIILVEWDRKIVRVIEIPDTADMLDLNCFFFFNFIFFFNHKKSNIKNYFLT